jgi:hypothetical protein
MYADDPTLAQRVGPSGRVKCERDMHRCLEQLAPAVALEDPSLFARYVHWLENLLAVRGVDRRDVRRSLEVTASVLTRGLSPDESDCVLRSLEAGLHVLSDARAVKTK